MNIIFSLRNFFVSYQIEANNDLFNQIFGSIDLTKVNFNELSIFQLSYLLSLLEIEDTSPEMFKLCYDYLEELRDQMLIQKYGSKELQDIILFWRLDTSIKN